MLTIRDALSTLADQLPDSDASIHLPPVSPHTCSGSGSERSFRFEAKRLFGPQAAIDIDDFLLEIFEGDWHTVFSNLADLATELQNVDMGAPPPPPALLLVLVLVLVLLLRLLLQLPTLCSFLTGCRLLPQGK